MSNAEAIRLNIRPVFRRVLIASVVTLFYALFVAYPGARLITLIAPDLELRTGWLLTVFVLPLIPRFICEWRNNRATQLASRISMTWLGFCFLNAVPVAIWDLSHLAFDSPPAYGQAFAGVLILAGLLAHINARYIRVWRVNHPAPQSLQGIRIAHISDVHIGSLDHGHLQRAVRHALATNPHYIAITGDLIDFAGISEARLQALADLPVPCFFVIGNHERYVDCDAICERLQALGVEVLRNRSVCVNGIQWIGIDDAERRDQVPRELAKIARADNHYPILLYHRPDGAEAADAWGARLMLTGHTHNGQIIPFNYLVRRVFPRVQGSYQIGGLTLYVSPGTGVWGPVLRVGSHSEVTLHELR